MTGPKRKSVDVMGVERVEGSTKYSILKQETAVDFH